MVCQECDTDEDGSSRKEEDSPSCDADNGEELPPDSSEDGACVDCADDVDAAAVEASIERNVLRPLRRACGVGVPQGLLSREQAWSLAHASEVVASTADEMVDPWDCKVVSVSSCGGALCVPTGASRV